MSAEPRRLDDLIASVADGNPIDWNAVDASALGDRQRRLLKHLRVVADVAEVHRSAPAEEPIPATMSVMPIGGLGRTVPCWGHLLLFEQIGDGSFGDVYRARDPWLDREVALKLLKADATAGVPVGRILNEARTLARVRHANVVTVYGADINEGRVGLWMELVRGRTLADVLASGGTFSASEAALIGQELCRALAAVHAAGLIHRDVKAQNLMRESGGRLVLMDFGAGQLVGGGVTSRPAGTPLYLAPELLNGSDATVQTDIYAVGVLLYYLVTGEYPVTGSSLRELCDAHQRGERRHLGDVRPDLPDAFVGAVEGALNPNPKRRFATAGEMQHVLAKVTSGDSLWRTAPIGVDTPLRRRFSLWSSAAAATVVLALSGAATYWHFTDPTRTVAHAAVELIAVLPLQDLGGADTYLADSMTEALTQELSTAGPIKVVSRTSVARLVSLKTPIPELAKTLNADAVVEGSVFRSGQDIRVNVRVIHAGTDTAVWASTFERASPDLPRLQQEIARAIASELRLALHPRTVERWQRPQVLDARAYDEYLRGRYELRRLSQPGVQSALEHFRRSAAIQSQYARAHAGIAQCYLLLASDFGAIPIADGTRLAKAAVVRALAIDDALPDAHGVLAEIKFEFDWDFKGADDQYRRAIELDPSFVEPRLDYAMFLASRGRFDEAFQQISAARAVDPFSAAVADRAAALHYYARQYEQALVEVQRAIQLEPARIASHVGLSRVLNAMGRHEEAIAESLRTAAQGANHPIFEAEIAQGEIAAGRVTDARRRVARLWALVDERSSGVAPHVMALAYARLDPDQAFTWLERAFESKSGRVLWLKVDPRVDPLRSDARFGGFLKRLELEP